MDYREICTQEAAEWDRLVRALGEISGPEALELRVEASRLRAELLAVARESLDRMVRTKFTVAQAQSLRAQVEASLAT